MLVILGDLTKGRIRGFVREGFVRIATGEIMWHVKGLYVPKYTAGNILQELTFHPNGQKSDNLEALGISKLGS